LKILYPNQDNLNFENFKNFILSEKENDIVNKLKNKYKELEKTKRDEIKEIFDKINMKSSLQRYFEEMKNLMYKDKLKEIYLFNDYLNIIEKAVCNLNSEEEINKNKIEEEKEKKLKEKKLEEKRKKEIEEEKKKKLEEERKKEIEEEYKRKKIEEEERRKEDEEKKKKREEEEKKRLSKNLNNEIINKRNSYLKNGKNESKKNSNAFNPEEFLKLVEK
jgi:hypothetical protein